MGFKMKPEINISKRIAEWQARIITATLYPAFRFTLCDINRVSRWTNQIQTVTATTQEYYYQHIMVCQIT
jgi:hypothetical protein